MGPKLTSVQVTDTSKYLDIITNYENSSEITRTRVRRGHEEESLLSLFPKGFIILHGNRKPIADKLTQIKTNGALLRIQAPYGTAAKAIESESVSSASLNSGDAFLLVAPGGGGYVWMGAGANEPERDLGEKISDTLGLGGIEVIEEEKEPDAFWDLLGGKGEYQKVKDMGVAAGFEPRLFHCSNVSGYFYVQEIFNFTQEDMLNDDIMLLDAYSTVFMWIGNRSNAVEKRGATKAAQKYIDNV